jgi:energy-coupling factor transporter ATP-binding protein EcfA2
LLYFSECLVRANTPDTEATTSKDSAGPSKARREIDAQLVKAVAGITQEEMEDLAEQDLPEVAFKKLQNPSLVLSAEEAVECLTGCIAVGATRAKQVKDKDVLMFIGSAGSGKSTMVNFLRGCDMETFKPNRNVLQSAIRVRDGSRTRELTGAKIKHGKQNMTFVPGIGSDENFTYLDCPGFLGNRGAEINIASTVNIKQTVYAAKSVAVVVLIDYWSLLVDRGREFRDLAQIMHDLFGSTSQLEEHAGSIALGISKVPTVFEEETVQLKHVQALLMDTQGLHDHEARLVTILSNSLFIAHPANAMDPGPGWLDRDALIRRLRSLRRVNEPGRVFQTVLMPGDTRALRAIVEELTRLLQDAMKENDFVTAADLLARLTNIDVIDNLLVTRLLYYASDTVHRGLISMRERAMASMIEEAEVITRQLQAAARALRHNSPGFAAFAEQAATTVGRQTEQRRKDIQSMESLRRDLREQNLQSEAIQRRLKEVERQLAGSAADVTGK